MKAYSFIEESKRHLVNKILSRYDAEGKRKIREKMISLGKSKGGWYSPDEYGILMRNGQRLRIRNLNPTAKFRPAQNPLKSATDINDFIYGKDLLTIPSDFAKIPNSFKRKIASNQDFPAITGGSKRVKRKFKRRIQNSTNNYLDQATNTAHEADEYSEILRLSKRHNTTPERITQIYGHRKPSKVSTIHINKNIIDRENERNRILSALYGRDTFFQIPRSNLEYKNLFRNRSTSIK